jgi:hypothetical protein
MQQNVMNSMLALTEAQVDHQADRITEDVLRAISRHRPPNPGPALEPHQTLITGQERLLAQVARVQSSLDAKLDPAAPTVTPWLDHPLVAFLRRPGTRKAAATMAYMLASYLTAYLSLAQFLLEALKTAATPEVKKIRLECACPCPGVGSVFQDLAVAQKSALGSQVTQMVETTANNFATTHLAVVAVIWTAPGAADAWLTLSAFYVGNQLCHYVLGVSILEWILKTLFWSMVGM